jgi:hypothetical protein
VSDRNVDGYDVVEAVACESPDRVDVEDVVAGHRMREGWDHPAVCAIGGATQGLLLEMSGPRHHAATGGIDPEIFQVNGVSVGVYNTELTSGSAEWRREAKVIGRAVWTAQDDRDNTLSNT